MIKQKIKSNRGITIVSLIIAVIILIILATITLKQLSDDGIVGETKSAKESYINKEQKEKIKEIFLKVQDSSKATTDEEFLEELKEELERTKFCEEVEVVNNSIIITTKEKNEFTLYSDGNLLE